MLNENKKKVLIPVASVALTILLAFGVWFALRGEDTSGKQVVQFSMQTYSSLEELAVASDAVIIGTVKGAVGHEIDYGTADSSQIHGLGIPNVFYQVEVSEVLRGVVDKTIVVATLDPEVASFIESVTPWKTGERLLLFLAEQNAENAPGIKTYNHFYATISLDNGVFDVLDGDLVRPRMIGAFVQPTTGNSDETITFSLIEVKKEVITK
jgi:hypothetical protein